MPEAQTLPETVNYFFFSSFLTSALGASFLGSSFLAWAMATREVEAIAPAITAAKSFFIMFPCL